MNHLDLLSTYFTLASEFFVIQYLILFSIITCDPYSLVLLISCYMKIIVNKIMKYYANLYLPSNISDRPFDATSTNIFDSNLVLVSDIKRGFPSGHAMAMSFISTLAFFRFKQCPFVYILAVLTIGTGWSRYYKKAHTVLQICMGYLTGILYGLCIQAITNRLPYSDQQFWDPLLTVPNITNRRIIFFR